MNHRSLRHHALWTLLLAVLLRVGVFPASAMETLPTPVQLESRLRGLGPAPRLFASAADWAALPARLKTDPVAAAIYRDARRRADAALAGPLVEHRLEGRRRLLSARQLLGRVLDLATVARVENDARAAARAREELLAAAALPDWNPAHFLDVAEYALAVAVGLDWLHDALSPADRELLGGTLVDHALRPSFAEPPPGWIAGENNWTQVCHAGLAAAALATADRDPALAARTLTRAIANQAGPARAYAPDGAYPEGPMYWGYGTSFEVVLISLVTHAFGTDFGLADAPGFLASADFLTLVTGPGGRYFNYSDCRERASSLPVLHWFAARLGQPHVAAPEVLRLEANASSAPEAEPGGDRLNALALWWHRSPPVSDRLGGAVLPTRKSLPRNWLGRGQTPVAVFRSSWEDPRATFLGIKAGSPSGPHAHMDAGSFVLEADGVRWAVDPGMQEYYPVEAAGVGLWDARQAGGRWTVFRLGADAHNVLRFDGAPQLVNGAATFLNFAADGPAPHAALDLSPLYADQARAVQRRVSLLPDRRVLFEDSWTLGARPAKVAWQWLTRAAVTVDADRRTILLQQDGATLRLRVLSPAPVKFMDEDVSKAPHPYEAANPGLRRVSILSECASGEAGRLAVVAEPGSAVARADLPDPKLTDAVGEKP